MIVRQGSCDFLCLHDYTSANEGLTCPLHLEFLLFLTSLPLHHSVSFLIASSVPQVFVSMIFLFISFLAPAIAFGGIMEEVTNNHIGETETLVATGMCGIVYGLFAVQPLSILAFTGPLLLMEEIVYDVSDVPT